MSTRVWKHADNGNKTVFIARVNDSINYVISLDFGIDASKEAAIVEMLEDETEKVLSSNPNQWSVQSTLTKMAEQIVVSNTSTKVLNANEITNASLLQYNAEADLSGYDIEKARALNEPIYEDRGFEISPTIRDIKSQSSIDTNGGIYVNKKRIETGNIVDPFSIEKGNIELHDTIGGSDITVFMLMEVPMYEDLHLPTEIQRKESILIEMDSVLSISYSTIRDVFPVRSLGHINQKGVVRGARTISGHIAFAVFTEDILSRIRGKLISESNNIAKKFSEFKGTQDANIDAVNKYTSELKRQYYQNSSALMKVQMLDSLPPFHLLCLGMSETSGNISKILIKGVSIIDENQYQGTQQPNIVNKVSYVATDIIPMTKIENNSHVAIHSVNSVDESFMNGKYKSRINYNYEVTGSALLDSVLNDLDKEVL